MWSLWITKHTPVSTEVSWVLGTPAGTGDKDQIHFLLYHINTAVVDPISSDGIRPPKVDLGDKIGIYYSFDGVVFCFLSRKCKLNSFRLQRSKFLPHRCEMAFPERYIFFTGAPAPDLRHARSGLT